MVFILQNYILKTKKLYVDLFLDIKKTKYSNSKKFNLKLHKIVINNNIKLINNNRKYELYAKKAMYHFNSKDFLLKNIEFYKNQFDDKKLSFQSDFLMLKNIEFKNKTYEK